MKIHLGWRITLSDALGGIFSGGVKTFTGDDGELGDARVVFLIIDILLKRGNTFYDQNHTRLQTKGCDNNLHVILFQSRLRFIIILTKYAIPKTRII